MCLNIRYLICILRNYKNILDLINNLKKEQFIDHLKVLGKMKNPKISGIEGFFILESSLDEELLQILKTYKNRDKTEKIIKAMKD